MNTSTRSARRRTITGSLRRIPLEGAIVAIAFASLAAAAILKLIAGTAAQNTDTSWLPTWLALLAAAM